MFINSALTFPFRFAIIQKFLILLLRDKMPSPKDPIKYEEYRRKQSESHKNPSDETRRNMSEAQKIRYEDPIKAEENRRKLSEALKKHYEDPIKGEATRRKLSEAAKLRAPQSEATRRKMSESHKNLSDETRRKMSEAQKKRYEDPEVHLKQSEAQKGEKNPFFGREHSEETRRRLCETAKLRAPPSAETRRKISEEGKGRKHSEETRKKMSVANKMRAPPSAETRRKISEAWKLRAPTSEETRRKLSEARIGKPRSEETIRKMRENMPKGEKSVHWMGGVSFFPYCQKFNNEFKERVRAFFNHQCVECGTPQKEKKLGVHHVNFDKQSCCNDTFPLFVPLCPSCHTKTNHNREYWEQYFTDMINKYYGGKCYYTKEEMPAIKRVKHQ